MRDSYRLLKGRKQKRPQKRSEPSTRTTPKMSRLMREERLVAAMTSELRACMSGLVVYANESSRTKGSAASARKKTIESAQRKVDARIIGT